MSLSIAIVGLPNVGKSTLFNALVKNSKAQAANYPFCTIDPNVGIVEVPDNRLQVLSDISSSAQIVPAIVEFVDIAGLVAGAAKGEGLGNKFLANIRECDAIAMVIRLFENPDIIFAGRPKADQPRADKVSPEDDIKTIETELQLADLAVVEKRLESAKKEIKTDKNAVDLVSGLEKILKILNDGQNSRKANLTEKEAAQIKLLQLLTMKPVLYIANVDEKQLSDFSCHSDLDPSLRWDDNIDVIASTAKQSINFIPISAKIEAELNELPDAEKQEYLSALDLKTSGLDRLIQKAYDILGLQTYLTSGEKETRAWTIKKGATAPQAAGVIHGDFERGFIAADVVKYDDFVTNHGWAGAKEKGLVKTQGRDYIMADGDIVVFKFNV
jgi:GTP-binding protein YchF